MKFPLANAITIFRVVLFAFFIFLAANDRIYLAAIFFVVAWALDAVDGWVARSRGQASAFGSLLDKVVDRTMFIAAGGLLIGLGIIPAIAFWLLVKDMAMSPALTIAWKAKKEYPGAGKLGRLTSVMQGVGVDLLKLGVPYPLLIVVPTALLGAFTAFVYTKELVKS